MSVRNRDNGSDSAWWRIVLLIALLGSFALRLYALTRQDIWWDEARNIDVALRPFGQVALARELDIHPPIYFWLLHGWGRLVGSDINAVGTVDPALIAYLMRFVSVWAGVVSIPLLYQLTRRSVNESAALCAALIATVSPFWLAESQEARMYTVGIALLTAASVAFLHAIQDRAASSENRRPQITPAPLPLITFVTLSALAFLTHYNALFILVAWYGWWGMDALTRGDRWRRLGTVLGCGLATTLLVLPVAPIALRQIPTYANPNLVIPSLSEYLAINWQSYLGGYAWTADLLMGRASMWLWGLFFVLVAGLIVHLGFVVRGFARRGTRERMRTSVSHTTFLLMWLLGGLALYFIAVLDRGAFNARYASFITPALYALLGVALAALGRLTRWLAVLGLVVVLLGLIPAVRADLSNPHFDREHIGDVVAWLRTNTGPGDVIFVDQKYPFGFYYQRYTMSEEATPQGAEGAPARYLFVDINTLDQRLTTWAGDAQRLFWVQWFESDTDPRRAVSFLLDKVGRRAGEQTFIGYEIDWWELTPPTTFELAPDLTPAHYIFPPAVQTLAVSLPKMPVAPGGRIPVVIRWQRLADGQVDRSLKARVALHRTGSSSMKGQADERLLNDRHRLPSEWSLDEQPLNVYRVPVPNELEAGEYELRLIVYDAETLEPLPLVDAMGQAAGIEAVLGIVEIGP